MATIAIHDLTFAYPGSYDNVFERVSLHWDSSWRLGLIGRNGRGKTTLLRLLLGQYPYQGRISAPLGFSYFPYAAADIDINCRELARRICPQHQDWQLEYELSLLGAELSLLERNYATLSHGERSKLQLAAMFLREDALPLIDEPTNHLDQQDRLLLGEYLAKKPGFLLISHDRALLDRCVDHIVAINRSRISVEQGNFSSWWRNKQYRDQFELAENARLQREIAHLSAAARQSAAWSDKVEAGKRGQKNSGVKADKGYIGAQAARMMKRAQASERRQERAAAEKTALLKDIEKAELLPIRHQPHHARILAELRGISISYGGRRVCGPLDLVLERGERLAITGKNGSGKSSLLKLMLGEDIPHTGSVRLAPQLKISYLPQQTSRLSGSPRELINSHGLDESLFKTILRKLGFERAALEKDLSALSEGQKKKALLAKSLCEEGQLYLWDEPLNYIDLFSRLQIEEVILAAQPTMIFIEHDAAFVAAAATRTLEL